jgi:hypothetical protein
MGAKTWMLAYVDGDAREVLKLQPALNREAAARLARKLYASEKLEEIEDGDLLFTSPPDDELYVGCFPGLSILAAKEFGIDYPSKLSEHFLKEGKDGRIILHAMHSVVDWVAFAIWEKGKLRRSLSLAPDNGVIEDIGPRLTFEEPFWAGEHPVFDEGEEGTDYPFCFHPLELGGKALLEFFGYELEGFLDQNVVDPAQIAMAGFKRKSRWKLW